MKGKQLRMDAVLEDVTRYELAREKADADRILEKLFRDYEVPDMRRAWNVEMPTGTVIIVSQDLYRNDHYTKHFYRTVLGYHNTVSGPMPHLIWKGNAEWPDEPPWGRDMDGRQKIYPDQCFHKLWTKWEHEEDE